MTIQDEMARAIRTAVLTKPEDYSPALVECCQKWRAAYDDWLQVKAEIEVRYAPPMFARQMRAGEIWREEYRKFQALIAENGLGSDGNFTGETGNQERSLLEKNFLNEELS